MIDFRSNPTFRISCPKCQSTNTHIEQDRKFNQLSPHIFVCYRCGHRIYGQPAIEFIARPQYDEYKKNLKRIEKERREVELQAAFLEEQRKKKENEVYLRCLTNLCSWKECDKGHSGPANSRANSKYCSRDCSNRNARALHKERKALLAG